MLLVISYLNIWRRCNCSFWAQVQLLQCDRLHRCCWWWWPGWWKTFSPENLTKKYCLLSHPLQLPSTVSGFLRNRQLSTLISDPNQLTWGIEFQFPWQPTRAPHATYIRLTSSCFAHLIQWIFFMIPNNNGTRETKYIYYGHSVRSRPRPKKI